ncbi:hypothetical protein NQZ79_g2832 [Umbelopsis isabellina]|nr:hypothetical protein NQZ79_g2832 [Umbelopsis isabellina]
MLEFFRRRPLLTAAAVLGVFAVSIPAYQDYQLYMSYGAGGVPHNAFGWFMSRCLLTPFSQEMLGTEVYQKKINQGAATTYIEPNGKLPQRSGTNPAMGPHVVPQRQISQLPDDEIKRKLNEVFYAFARKNSNLLKLAPSRLERHTDAIFLADTVFASPPTPEAIRMKGEICHIHGSNDHSVHVVLSPRDAKEAIEAGWGQRHGFSGWEPAATVTRGVIDLPAEYLFLYAPRDQQELDAVMELVKASVRFVSGGAEVKS